MINEAANAANITICKTDVLGNRKPPNFPFFPTDIRRRIVRTARGAAPLIVGFTLRKGRALVQCIE
jgi:hypothetical protein